MATARLAAAAGFGSDTPLVANLVPVSTVAGFQEEDMHDKNALQCRRNGQARMGVYTWPGLVGEEAPTKQESEHTRHQEEQTSDPRNKTAKLKIQWAVVYRGAGAGCGTAQRVDASTALAPRRQQQPLSRFRSERRPGHIVPGRTREQRRAAMSCPAQVADMTAL